MTEETTELNKAVSVMNQEIQRAEEAEAKVRRVAALAADLQKRGDTQVARLIFAALNGERA